MPEEISREEFERRLREMNEKYDELRAAAPEAMLNAYATYQKAMGSIQAAAEASAAALKRIADAMEPVGKMMEMYLRSYQAGLDEADKRYYPLCPVCEKDLVQELHLSTPEARIAHVQKCLAAAAEKKTENP